MTNNDTPPIEFPSTNPTSFEFEVANSEYPVILDENGDPIYASRCHTFLQSNQVEQIREFLGKGETSDSQNEFITSLRIESPEIVYRPKNLKYPNKKRKLRILKKWKKRFGWQERKTMFYPKAKIVTEFVFENNLWQTKVSIIPLEEVQIL